MIDIVMNDHVLTTDGDQGIEPRINHLATGAQTDVGDLTVNDDARLNARYHL